jgi:hypothetical protein
MTTAQRARPASTWAAPIASADRKPVQAEPTSKAPAPVAPSAWATSGAVPGMSSSDVVVATMTRSTSEAGTPARARAPRADSVACVSRRSSGRATRRSWMPVRRAIQSSSTPRRAPISALVTTVSGTLTATEAASTPGRAGSRGARANSDSRGKVVGMGHTLWTPPGAIPATPGEVPTPGGLRCERSHADREPPTGGPALAAPRVTRPALAGRPRREAPGE